MSYYLKYRPQTIGDLDLTQARETLQGILRSGEFAHAYLFAGPKGTGKTSSARIVAKLLNCDKNRKALEVQKVREVRKGKKSRGLEEPCGKCESCRRIARGSSMAVIEMDAASNRGIDDIRQLKERVGLAPSEGLYTVYVIDEVHMLTTEAFNALLKTLEEPPTHAVFVLCTTEAHMLPQTVVSRCTLVQFTKANQKEVARSLDKVVKGEGLKVEDGVIERISGRVDGSFRDGIKLLEQLATNIEGKVTLEAVDQMTGYSQEYESGLLLEMVYKGQVKQVLDEITRRSQAGVDFGILGKRIVEALREEVLEMATKKDSMFNSRKSLLEKMMTAIRQIKGSEISQLPIELALVEWMMENSSVNRNELGDNTASKRERVSRKDGKADRDGLKRDAGGIAKSRTKVITGKKNGSAGKGNLDGIMDKWVDILGRIRRDNVSLEAFLKATKPISVDGKFLTLEVFYAFHKEQLEQARHREMIDRVISELTGFTLRTKFVMKGKIAPDQTNQEIVNVTGKVKDEELAEAVEEIFG